MTQLTEQQLLNLKEEIEEAKKKVAELRGEKKHLMKELKEDWDCENIDQGEKKLDQMSKQLTKLKQDIGKGTEELIEKYDLEVQ